MSNSCVFVVPVVWDNINQSARLENAKNPNFQNYPPQLPWSPPCAKQVAALSAQTLYEKVMGEAFGRLSAPIRQFHRHSGFHQFFGWVEVDAPTSVAAALIARCLGTPLRASKGPIRFELEARPDSETWNRFFPSRFMSSRLVEREGRVVENLGVARLTFRLLEQDGELEMRLERMHFFGIPCPTWLMPQVTAKEVGVAENLHFHVQASMPLIGTVTRYRGYLEMSRSEPL